MTTTLDPQARQGEKLPTLDAPARGQVLTVVNDRELFLSEAEYWHDEGVVVVRSREFDCLAEGTDLDQALVAFGRAVYDYADALQDLDDCGGATEREREILDRLSRRISSIYLERRHQPSPSRRFLRRLRRGRPVRRSWRSTVAA